MTAKRRNRPPKHKPKTKPQQEPLIPILSEIKQSREDSIVQYSNMAVILHTKHEFEFDFLFALQSSPSLIARIITNPQHAKAIHAALGENIKKYEESFGTITMVTPAGGSGKGC